MKVAFFVRHFTERGTEVAVYDYAKYNEEILANKSLIICFTKEKQSQLGFPPDRFSYEKFKSRFLLIEINDILEMKNIIREHTLHFFYTLTHGGSSDVYQFENKDIWGECKTIKHCVFDSTFPEGDAYIALTEFTNAKCNTKSPTIPHIVTLPECQETMRSELNIPKTSIVIGRHGGYSQFNILITHAAIKEFLTKNLDVYFLFLNTQPFYTHPRIIYLERVSDNTLEKTKFINTCDAMIHARSEGEMFSLAIGEFSIKNKPIITCPCGDIGHVFILGEKGIYYTSKQELLNIFKNIKLIIQSREDWNAYSQYTPEYVMGLFRDNIFNLINVNAKI